MPFLDCDALSGSDQPGPLWDQAGLKRVYQPALTSFELRLKPPCPASSRLQPYLMDCWVSKQILEHLLC